MQCFWNISKIKLGGSACSPEHDMYHHPDFMPFTPRERSSLRAAATNMIENWPPQAYRDDYAIVSGMWPFLPKILLLSDPVLIEEVLINRPEMFTRDRFSAMLVAASRNDGRYFRARATSKIITLQNLFFAASADSRWQRRSVSPAFHHDKLLALVPTFIQCAQTLAQEWRQGPEGTIIDVEPAMSRVTLDAILTAVLGVDAQAFDRDQFMTAVNPSISTIGWRLLYARIGAPASLPFPGARRVAESMDWLHNTLTALVAQRRETGGEQTDILSLLLFARDPETGRVMSDEEIISNLYTFMIAGHEASATALSWTLWLLAHDHETQQRLRDEIEITVGSRNITVDDIDRLVFTRQVLQESMRLFPPAVGVGREPIDDIEIGPHRIRAGDLVIIPSWCVHRHEKLWNDPNGFDPDRFMPERAKDRHRCAYLPFGAGPRICIGMNFGMLEMVVILATLARDFRFSILPSQHLQLVTNLSLRAKNGLLLKINPA